MPEIIANIKPMSGVTASGNAQLHKEILTHKDHGSDSDAMPSDDQAAFAGRVRREKEEACKAF